MRGFSRYQAERIDHPGSARGQSRRRGAVDVKRRAAGVSHGRPEKIHTTEIIIRGSPERRRLRIRAGGGTCLFGSAQPVRGDALLAWPSHS